MKFKVKGAICDNCNGVLQNNLIFDAWFHVNSDALKHCGIVGGKFSEIYDLEIDPENGITVHSLFLNGGWKTTESNKDKTT